MMIILQKEWFSEKQCYENPQNLYVFGDNSLKYGKKGQAVIRDCYNSFGIPTKRKPSMNKDAFMRDESKDFKDVIIALGELCTKSYSYKNIIFPKDGIGTGLAKMKETSPILFGKMNNLISFMFDIKYEF